MKEVKMKKVIAETIIEEKNKMKFHIREQINWIFWTAIIIAIGLILFKYIPMLIYGENILFDASSHIVWTSWGLYVLWFFIDQKKSWRVPYFALCTVVLTIMGIQRIYIGAHNEIGLMLGLAIAGIAIVIPRWNDFKGGVNF